jgi:hypothetical protein
MKYVFLFLLTGIIISCTGTDKPSTKEQATRDSINNAMLKDTANFTSIEWLDSLDQNVGKINQGAVLEITWHFRNAGNKPLIIANVRPGCGCTGADWPREPIPPGKEGVITAKFNSGNYSGTQHKQAYVRSNTKTKSGGEEEILSFNVDIQTKKD